jgi:solute carrier family 25 folate transporter 32
LSYDSTNHTRYSYGEIKTRCFPEGKKLTSVDFLCSSASAGVLTAVLTNPLWVIKTRMLSLPASATGAYPSMVAGFRSILATDGPRGLMRGLVPAMFGVTHGAFQFMFYERLKNAFAREGEERLRTSDYLLTSAMAKIAAGGVTYPYKVVQTRTQNFESGYRGPLDVVTQIWRGEGVRGFYKG